jgi:hypothetical protein
VIACLSCRCCCSLPSGGAADAPGGSVVGAWSRSVRLTSCVQRLSEAEKEAGTPSQAPASPRAAASSPEEAQSAIPA